MYKILLTLLLGMLSYALFSATSEDFLNPCKSQPSFSDLQQKLSPNQVLLLYEMEANKAFLSLTLLHQNQQEMRKIPLPPNFAESVLEFYQLLQDFSIVQKSKRTEFIQTSHQFYELLLHPIEQYLQQEEHLIVIGQGVLQYLPFEVLLSNTKIGTFETLDFLVKKHPISYYFQPIDFLNSHTSQTPNFKKKILGFAPVFQKKNSGENGISSRLVTPISGNFPTFFDNIPALPYSEQEIKSIPKVLPMPSVLLLHQQAQKSTLTEQLQQNFQYVHLATHSFADFSDSRQAGILCAGGLDECDPKYEILYMQEIEKLRIKTDLVVLSSCQSGVGKLNADGVQGIHRSFYKAGAQNVVFSLWKVNDRICQRFMTIFYTEIAQGQTYSTALRAAKLDLLQDADTASPNVWAAFLMIGQ